MADVSKDFGTLEAVLNSFSRWREEHRESYDEVYVSAGLPALLAFFARLDLLRWKPLQASNMDDSAIEKLPFFEALQKFGEPQVTTRVLEHAAVPFFKSMLA